MAKKRLKIISTGGDITLKSIGTEDIELLRNWKNQNRKYFFYKDVISPSQQREWFNSYVNNEKENIFIVEYEGNRVGCMGFRLMDDVIDVYNVICGNKNFGGRGIMGRALRLMCSYIIDNHDREITLMVLLDNKKAIDWYVKNGFEETERKEDYIYMKLNINKFNHLIYNLENN
jgi:RimJ/RimL family protein N-acetyltransferase